MEPQDNFAPNLEQQSVPPALPIGAPVSQPLLQKPRRWWLWLALLVISMLVIAGGVYAFFSIYNQQSTQQGISQLPIGQPTNNENSTATSSISADWKTYHNEEYGFEIRYPLSNFKIREKGENQDVYLAVSIYPVPQPIEFGPYFSVRILKNSGVSDLNKYLQNQFGSNYISSESVSINGTSWLKVHIKEDYFEHEASTLFYSNRNGMVYVLSYFPINTEVSDVLEKITSTFRFIEPSGKNSNQEIYKTNFSVEPSSIQDGQQVNFYFNTPSEKANISYYLFRVTCRLDIIGMTATTNKISGNLCNKEIKLAPPTNFIPVTISGVSKPIEVMTTLEAYNASDVLLGDTLYRYVKVVPKTFANTQPSVTFSSSSIAGKSIYEGSRVPFINFSITAVGGDVTFNSLTIEKSGTLSAAALTKIVLIDSSGNEVGQGSIFNNDLVAINDFQIYLKAGETKTFWLYSWIASDLSSYRGEHAKLSIVAINGSAKILSNLPISSANMTVDLLEDTTPAPIINTITPQSAPIGAIVELRGINFSGFEGDKNAWIENSNGQKGIVYGMYPYSTSELIRFKLADKYCTVDTSYSGKPCPSYINITQGTYNIFVNPWGKTSNKVQLIVIQ